MNILKYRGLFELEISIYEMDIDLTIYNSSLALIERRLKVKFAIEKGNIDEKIV